MFEKLKSHQITLKPGLTPIKLIYTINADF